MLETTQLSKAPILDRNLVKYRDWKVGETYTPVFPSYPIGPTYGPGYGGDSAMLLKPGPINGKLSPSLVSTVGATLYTVHGGLVSQPFAIDETKTYRFSVWMKHNVATTGNGYSGLHFGHETFNKQPTSYQDGRMTSRKINTDGVSELNDANPYFLVVSYEQLPKQWMLCVGFVLGKDILDLSVMDEMGIYLEDGTHLNYDFFATKTFSSPGGSIPAYRNTYRWNADSQYASFRAFNSTPQTLNDEVQYMYPRVDLCDGTEPTVEQLWRGYDLNIMKRR
jgi:hypothetical protein